MQFSQHVHITGGALRDWFIAQCCDSLCVGLLWWILLSYLKIPLAPFWGILAALFQFVPHFGAVLSVIGPFVAASFTGGLESAIWVLAVFGVIAVLDGLLLQPLIMRRTARVPIWASLIVPIALSLVIGFWGVVLAAPLLAVVFAYRAFARKSAAEAARRNRPRQTPPGQEITGGVLLGPEEATKTSREI
jgi:predicted PurR-regulated permease PerM